MSQPFARTLARIGRVLADAVRRSATTTSRAPSHPTVSPTTDAPERGRTEPAPAPGGAPARRGGPVPSPYGAGSAVEITPLSLPAFDYAPHADGDPDPGEVVWTWVPYEDDPAVGKDRPALVLAHLDGDAIIVQLTSKDHDRDKQDEARWGRYWFEIGTGDWDAKGRVSEVRIDRLLRVAPHAMRREGGVLRRDIFDQVVEAVIDAHAHGL